MKLKEYIENLNSLTKDTPGALEMEVVSSSDDEGNSFQKVGYGPSLGKFEGDYYGDFTSDIEEGDVLNAVCIN